MLTSDVRGGSWPQARSRRAAPGSEEGDDAPVGVTNPAQSGDGGFGVYGHGGSLGASQSGQAASGSRRT